MPELDYTNLYNNDVQTKVTVSIIPIACFVLSTQLIRSLVVNKPLYILEPNSSLLPLCLQNCMEEII